MFPLTFFSYFHCCSLIFRTKWKYISCEFSTVSEVPKGSSSHFTYPNQEKYLKRINSNDLLLLMRTRLINLIKSYLRILRRLWTWKTFHITNQIYYYFCCQNYDDNRDLFSILFGKERVMGFLFYWSGHFEMGFLMIII